MSKRYPNLLIEDIIYSGSRILEYTAKFCFDDFLQDNKTLDAVIRNFEIIGEDANNAPYILAYRTNKMRCSLTCNTIKVAHRYVVQVSDTTMFNREPSVRTTIIKSYIDEEMNGIASPILKNKTLLYHATNTSPYNSPHIFLNLLACLQKPGCLLHRRLRGRGQLPSRHF